MDKVLSALPVVIKPEPVASPLDDLTSHTDAVLAYINWLEQERRNPFKLPILPKEENASRKRTLAECGKDEPVPEDIFDFVLSWTICIKDIDSGITGR